MKDKTKKQEKEVSRRNLRTFLKNSTFRKISVLATIFMTILLFNIATALAYVQSHNLSEVRIIDSNLNMGSYDISLGGVALSTTSGAAPGAILYWGNRDVSGNYNGCSNCISSAEVGFNYAASGSKGGAATDLGCTNCVALGSETTGNYAAGTAEAGDATGVACADCITLGAETSGNYAGSTSEGGAASDLVCTDCVNLATEATGTLGVTDGGTGTSTAFTAGSVIFAGASGIYSQDSTNFFWDNANDQLGIGIAAPGANLHISDDSDATIRLDADSNGGGAEENPRLEMRQDGGTTIGAIGFVGSAGQIFTNSLADAIYLQAQTADPLQLATNDVARLTIESAGDVGIGTQNPVSDLDVEGIVTISGGVSGAAPTPRLDFENYYDNSGNPSVSHIDLYGGTYGFGISSPSLNYISNQYHRFYDDADLAQPTFWIDTASNPSTVYLENNGRLSFQDSAASSKAELFMYTDDTFVIDNDASGDIKLRTSNSDNRVIILDSDGNVGMGKRSSGEQLEVYGWVPNIVINNTAETDAGIIFVDSAASSTQYGRVMYDASSDNALEFYVDSTTPRMRITDDDRVGIGTDAPATHLEVAGSGPQAIMIASEDHDDTALTFMRVGTGYVDWNIIDDGGYLILQSSNDDGATWNDEFEFRNTGQLHTTGSMYVDGEYRYETAPTREVTIPATAFTPWRTSGGEVYQGLGWNGAYIRRMTTSGELFAPVTEVPDGATITQFDCYLYDQTASGYSRAYLYRQSRSTFAAATAPTSMAYVATTGAEAGGSYNKVDTSIGSGTVNYGSYIYFIMADSSIVSTSLGIMNCRIQYTTPYST